MPSLFKKKAYSKKKNADKCGMCWMTKLHSELRYSHAIVLYSSLPLIVPLE